VIITDVETVDKLKPDPQRRVKPKIVVEGCSFEPDHIYEGIPADEVLGEWLRQEHETRSDIRSQVDTVLGGLGVGDHLVTTPDYTNPEENRARRSVLAKTGRAATQGELGRSAILNRGPGQPQIVTSWAS
jgi:hypothetical protein